MLNFASVALCIIKYPDYSNVSLVTGICPAVAAMGIGIAICNRTWYNVHHEIIPGKPSQ